MSLEVRIPSVGESISSGLLAEWHHKDGDHVKSGDVLLTLETDKVSTEISAEGSGVLRIDVPEGEEVEVGAVVGRIEEGDGAAAEDDRGTKKRSPEKTAAGKKSGKSGKSGKSDKADPPGESESESEKPSKTSAQPAKEAKEVPEPLLREVKSEPAAAATPSAERDTSERVTRKRMTPLRRKIADQLVNAQQTAAILTTFNECDMSAVMGLRKQLQEDFVNRHGVKLGFMSIFIKAVVDALKAVPQVNVQVQGDEVVHQHFYDIGVAVGTEKGLIVPVIRDCDSKSFAELEQELGSLALRAKEGKIGIEDLQGGVFTISNGGVYGSLLSTPILNPPQSGILGMHSIQPRPVAVDGKVEIRPMMYLALSYDHRVVDGKEAVTFLVRVKQCIENPTRLLIGA